jgi:hypothetical protein
MDGRPQSPERATPLNGYDFSVLDKSSLEVYTLSIQRQNGIKPADVNRILRNALDKIRQGEHGGDDCA